MPAERQRLAATFDSVAEDYQQARPDYPAELFDELERLAGLTADSRLLEVGCATGKATLPLARRGAGPPDERRGYRITCVEMGPGLAARARRNLAAFPRVSIVEAAFEVWRPSPPTTFDLVFAATSWHWIDPMVRYQRAWRLLRPGGHLAFWAATHVVPLDGDPFFAEIQDIYDEIGEGLPPGETFPRPGELPDQRTEIEESGLFTDVAVRQFDWAVSYDAEQYVRLLDTFSGHIAMAPWQRDRLYREVRRRLAQRADGRLRRHWGAVLHVARRAEGSRLGADG